MLIAEATALLYIGAAEGTEWEHFWQDVLKLLRYGEFANDARGNDEGQDVDVTLH